MINLKKTPNSVLHDRAAIRTRELTADDKANLYRLVREGRMQRIARGLYVPTAPPETAFQTFAEAAARVPHGVICLLSALRFPELTTQNPFQVWLAIDRKARRPNVPELPLHVVTFSGEAFTAGINEHMLAGVSVHIYSPAKTVADCFKYRNKIGIDVAMEALRDCWFQGKATMDELWHFARICRVANVMRPYLQALTQ